MNTIKCADFSEVFKILIYSVFLIRKYMYASIDFGKDMADKDNGVFVDGFELHAVKS
jgi:hypothetical protein